MTNLADFWLSVLMIYINLIYIGWLLFILSNRVRKRVYKVRNWRTKKTNDFKKWVKTNSENLNLWKRKKTQILKYRLFGCKIKETNVEKPAEVVVTIGKTTSPRL